MIKNSVELWPHNSNHNIKDGYSDEYLSNIIDNKWLMKHMGIKGYHKNVYWRTELYSIGRCLRIWMGLPNWAPFPLYGDHGVSVFGKLQQHEIDAKPLRHLVWSSRKEKYIQNHEKKTPLRVIHPWISYRRIKNISLSNDASGTIIFFAHSVNGIEIVDYNWDAYFKKLKKLPKYFHPFVICMHRHDIEKGYHKKLRKYNIAIVSAGDSLNPYFVDRFYDIITKFKYATSNSPGSELFYCEEIGQKYFILGQEPVRYNFSHPEYKKGTINSTDMLSISNKKIRYNLFSQFPPTNNSLKDDYVEEMLGIDINENKVKSILWRYYLIELTRHIPEVIAHLIKISKYKISKIMR